MIHEYHFMTSLCCGTHITHGMHMTYECAQYKSSPAPSHLVSPTLTFDLASHTLLYSQSLTCTINKLKTVKHTHTKQNTHKQWDHPRLPSFDRSFQNNRAVRSTRTRSDRPNGAGPVGRASNVRHAAGRCWPLPRGRASWSGSCPPETGLGGSGSTCRPQRPGQSGKGETGCSGMYIMKRRVQSSLSRSRVLKSSPETNPCFAKKLQSSLSGLRGLFRKAEWEPHTRRS